MPRREDQGKMPYIEQLPQDLYYFFLQADPDTDFGLTKLKGGQVSQNGLTVRFWIIGESHLLQVGDFFEILACKARQDIQNINQARVLAEMPLSYLSVQTNIRQVTLHQSRKPVYHCQCRFVPLISGGAQGLLSGSDTQTISLRFPGCEFADFASTVLSVRLTETELQVASRHDYPSCNISVVTNSCLELSSVKGMESVLSRLNLRPLCRLVRCWAFLD